MKITLWINAFIPKTVAGYTKTVGGPGLHKGKTAVPLPKMARLHPFNLVKHLDTGYLTDQRGFDSSKSASVRMRSLVELLWDGMSAPIVKGQVHESSGTTEVDIDNGKHRGFAVANMRSCSFGKVKPAVRRLGGRTVKVPFGPTTTVFMGAVAPSHPTFTIDVSGSASDPLVWAAANIDYVGRFTMAFPGTARQKAFISFTGRLDEFPAFEAYAEVDGITKTLFRNSPPKGNTVTDLLGPASRPIFGSASFP